MTSIRHLGLAAMAGAALFAFAAGPGMADDIEVAPPPVALEPDNEAPPPGCRETTVRTEDENGSVTETRMDCPPIVDPGAPTQLIAPGTPAPLAPPPLPPG